MADSATLTAIDDVAVQVTGGRPLVGRIEVQGSKNVALHLYAAAILADAPVVLHAAPAILDTDVCAQILAHTGARSPSCGTSSWWPLPPRCGRRSTWSWGAECARRVSWRPQYSHAAGG
ncbi:hypothetical protein PV963_43275 [Streptomyces coeruleorubidus]|uniref:hypothetical protein n=1 Tax=Streptomyces coeruleorubidus TaxID=116188 RepID=UPI00237F7861|nr:hypothetical protein [Streptomyces coeruleorubidus]WDV57092.1 hypothetical protein PV963_43275 [Streptomyces coeruleorubidus]